MSAAARAWPLLALLAAACARTPAPRAAPRVAPLAAPARAAAPWRALVRDALPSPVRALAARRADSVAVVAGERGYLVDDEGVWPLCAGEIGEGDAALDVAVSPTHVLLFGYSERRPTIWRTTRDDDDCEALEAAGVPAEELGADGRIRAHGRDLWLWGGRGVVARSRDEGRRWSVLPRLRGVSDVFSGPGGETWASAVNGAEAPSPGALRHRGRLLRLDEGNDPPRWRVVAHDQLLPIASTPGQAQGWRFADAGALLRVDARGALERSTWLPWSRSRDDAPQEIVSAGRARFFASAGRALFRVDDDGLHALGALPSGSIPLRIDAYEDGTLWAIDLQGLWRGGFDGAWRERWQRPWSATSLLAVAARGRRVAVATDTARVVVTDDDGASWGHAEVPQGVGRVIAMGMNDRGTVLALSERGAVMGDARGLTTLPAPLGRGSFEEAPSVHSVGDRWIVLRGGVWTSDDDGAQWIPRLGTTARPGGDEVGVTHLVVRRGRALAMDGEFGLWRSDDAGASWLRVGADAPCPVVTRPRWSGGRTLLAWDGADRVAVLGRSLFALSDDGGRHWSARVVAAAGGSMHVGATGEVFVVATRGGASGRLCDGGADGVLAAGGLGGFALARDACEHRGDLVTFDGEAGEVVTVQRGGAAWRGRLDALFDPAAPTAF
ncbi:MAG: hypothetical protein R3A48_20290 [Polyangiales bacterium]